MSDKPKFRPDDIQFVGVLTESANRIKDPETFRALLRDIDADLTEKYADAPKFADTFGDDISDLEGERIPAVLNAARRQWSTAKAEAETELRERAPYIDSELAKADAREEYRIRDAAEFTAIVETLLAAKPPWRVSVSERTGRPRRDRWSKHGVAAKLGWTTTAADERFNHPRHGHLYDVALAKLANAPKPSA